MAAALSLVAIVFSAPLSETLFHGSHLEVANGLTVNEVAGFSRVGFVADYVVVVDVVPAISSSSEEDVGHSVPTDSGGDVTSSTSSNTRHIGAHIYDRSTGMQAVGLSPRIEVIDTGTGIATLADLHSSSNSSGHSDGGTFGGDLVIEGDRIISIRVILNDGQEVVVDGYLS